MGNMNMVINKKNKILIQLMTVSFFFYFFFSSAAIARVITQLTPTLTVTQEYIDNYLKTANGTDELISTIDMGFSLGFLEKKHRLYFAYNPMYKFYDERDQNDGLDHVVSLNGDFRPSKLSIFGYGINWTQTAVDRVGESRSSNIFANGRLQVSDTTSLQVAQDYSRRFDQQVDNGSFSESDVNNSSIGITHQFGEKDSIGLNYEFAFTDFKTENSNDFNKSTPSIFLSKYFTPLLGMEAWLAYETIDYELFNNKTDTFSGNGRLIKSYTRHFDVYLNYRHTYSDQTFDTHQTYHPSVGFDWRPTPDTGISLGVGVIFRRYDVRSDSNTENLFFDIDMYKIFNFSKRSTLSITGSSGYGEIDTDAASLGFNIYHQAGFNYTYKLTKRLITDFTGSYRISEYESPDTNRTDMTANIGASLSWTILKWLELNLAYDFYDFSTDSARDDYTVNEITLSLSMIPTRPVQMEIPASRTTLEDKIFN